MYLGLGLLTSANVRNESEADATIRPLSAKSGHHAMQVLALLGGTCAISFDRTS